MANERVRIDDLPSTSFPSLDHIVAAMKDGSTVRLTVAQLREVMLGGANDVALALKDLSNTTGPRGKLGGKLVPGAGVDLNNLKETGFWSAAPGVTNAPEPTRYYLIRVESSDNILYSTQYATAFANDTTSDSLIYKRDQNNGTWSAWSRVRENEAELDGRYNLPAGAVMAFDRTTAPAGWLKSNGALLLRTAYAALDDAIYCGDANNPTAQWGYRTNSTDTVRSTTGTHIRLCDYRGEFIRGWDDGRGVDSGRSLWDAQEQSYQSHNHTVNDSGHTHNNVGGSSAVGSGQYYAGQAANSYIMAGSVGAITGISINSSGYAETRPRNKAALICIKY